MIKKDDKTFGIVIQARTNSNRLPKKVVLDFYKGKSIIEIIIEKTLNKYDRRQIILATTKNMTDDIICEIGKKFKINVFRGCENNVLNRFIEAAQFYGINKIIRICADNPFIKIESINNLIEKANNEIDYIGFIVNNSLPAIKSHLGLYPEYVSIHALIKILNSTVDTKYFEHVTNYLYENPDKFNIKWINADEVVYHRNDIRLTIDTEADFNLTKKLYAEYNKLIKQDLKTLISLIDSSDNYLKNMKTQITENRK